MLPNAVFIRRQVNAIDFVLGDVTVEPLNLRPHGAQNLQRAQGNLPDLRIRQASGPSYFAFDYKLRHSRHQNIIPLRTKDFVT